jgi:hypothetical protein
LAIYATIPGIVTVGRDRADLDEILRPAIILLDGKEEPATRISGNTQPTQMPPAYFWLIMQTWYLAQKRDTLDNQYLNQVLNPIGPELMAVRAKIIPAVIQDDTLVALSQGGRVEYRGYDTDMQSGSTMGAEGGMMNLHFAISYPLVYQDLM